MAGVKLNLKEVVCGKLVRYRVFQGGRYVWMLGVFLSSGDFVPITNAILKESGTTYFIEGSVTHQNIEIEDFMEVTADKIEESVIGTGTPVAVWDGVDVEGL
jgi:hypothetical protein